MAHTEITLDDLNFSSVAVNPVAEVLAASPLEIFVNNQNPSNLQETYERINQTPLQQKKLSKTEELRRLADMAIGKEEQKQELISKHTKILASMFSNTKIQYTVKADPDDDRRDDEGNKKLLTFDILQWYYDNRKYYGITEDFEQQKEEVVYGKFIWQGLISEYIDELTELSHGVGSDVISAREFKTEVYRRALLREDITTQASIDDINAFVKVMIQNKIRSDREVNENLGNELTYCGEFTHRLDGDSKDGDVGTVGRKQILCGRGAPEHLIDEIIYNDLRYCWSKKYDKKLSELAPCLKTWNELRILFCEIELEGWKKVTNEKYHKYIKSYGAEWLALLKSSFVDKFGDPFRPLGWQCDILLAPTRYMYVAASRRSGKTYLATYLAGRQLYLPGQQIMYIIPTKENHSAQPWRYFVAGLSNDENVEILESSLEIKHKFPKLGEGMTSEIKFYSDKKVSVRSQTTNLVVYDEMAFLDEDTCDAARPSIATEKGYIYGISTVDPDTPKNHFYYDLVDAEIEMNSVGSSKKGLRVTLLDNPFIDDDEKEQIIKDGIRKPKKFRAEWMADFQESSVFDLSKFWKIDYDPMYVNLGDLWSGMMPIHVATMNKNSQPYKQYIVLHDCGRVIDKPGFAVLGLNPGIVETVCSGYLEGLDFHAQAAVLAAAHAFFGKDKTEIMIEYNQNGMAIDEILVRNHSLYATTVYAAPGMSEKQDGRHYTIGKQLLLTQLKVGFSSGILKAYSFMNHLRKEVETYSGDDAENDKRKGGHHFDILSALRIGAYFAEKWHYFEDEGTVEKEIIEDSAEYIQRLFGGGLTNGKSGAVSEINRVSKYGY